MNCHDHALMRSPPRAQGGPGSERILRIDNAIACFGQVPTQRVANEHLMPVQIPCNAGRLADPLQDKRTEAEDGKVRSRPHENGVTNVLA